MVATEASSFVLSDEPAIEVARLRRELAAAIARADAAERRATRATADAVLVVRAALSLATAVDGAPTVPVPARDTHAPVAEPDPLPDDDFFAALKRALDDDVPLGPRDDVIDPADDPARIDLGLDAAWWEANRGRRPLIRARSVLTFAVAAGSALGALGALAALPSVRLPL